MSFCWWPIHLGVFLQLFVFPLLMDVSMRFDGIYGSRMRGKKIYFLRGFVLFSKRVGENGKRKWKYYPVSGGGKESFWMIWLMNMLFSSPFFSQVNMDNVLFPKVRNTKMLFPLNGDFSTRNSIKNVWDSQWKKSGMIVIIKGFGCLNGGRKRNPLKKKK